jgi:hypothetical protein
MRYNKANNMLLLKKLDIYIVYRLKPNPSMPVDIPADGPGQFCAG